MPTRRMTRPAIALSVAAALSLAAAVGTASPAQAKDSTSWEEQGITTGIKGVDVSLWQHGYTPDLDFTKLRASGVQFVFIKSSDGLPKGDESAAKWWPVDSTAAASAGIVYGGYHYAQPTEVVANLRADAKAQAKLAARRVMPYRAGQIPGALDLESAPKKLKKAHLTLWAETYLRKYKKITKRTPFLYSYNYFIQTRLNPSAELSKYPLWLAGYGMPRKSSALIPGWRSPLVWQFTSSGVLPGSGSSRIDLDVYYGTPTQLRKLAHLSKKKAVVFGLV